MASPEEVTSLLPETLPEDFSAWDGEESDASAPVNAAEWAEWEAAHFQGKSPKPPGQFADHAAILPPLDGRPRVSGPASSTAFAKKQADVEEDSKAPPAPAPVKRIEWSTWLADHSLGKSSSPVGESADRHTISSAAVDKPRVSESASSAAVSKPEKSTSDSVDASSTDAAQSAEAALAKNEIPAASSLPNAAAVDGVRNSPEVADSLNREADEGSTQPPPSENIEAEGDRKKSGKKRLIIVAVGASAILIPLALMVPQLHHATAPAAKPSIQEAPKASTQRTSATPSLSASQSPTQAKLPAATVRREATDDQPASDEGASSAHVQSKMMTDQLAAPSVIPQAVKKQVADNAPPPVSFGAAGADGLGGTGLIEGVLHGQTRPLTKVAAVKPLAISSGVAIGMLIQKSPPVYPALAKAAGVSGTVELHAIISASGAIKDLQVVSGPEMLRQAAVDAVRSWRYKPYRLNNTPTEVETTVNVIFTLGR